MADHNPNILAMHGEAVVPNKRVAVTVVDRRAGNSIVVGYREDPNRWGGGFGHIPCGEAALAGDSSACDGYVLHGNCVAADHKLENLVNRGYPKGSSWLYTVVGPTGRDETIAQAEGGRIDDDDS